MLGPYTRHTVEASRFVSGRFDSLLARKGKPTNLYGHTLVPIEVSRDWIVTKVELEHDAS